MFHAMQVAFKILVDILQKEGTVRLQDPQSFWSYLILSYHVTSDVLKQELERTAILYCYPNMFIPHKKHFIQILWMYGQSVEIIFSGHLRCIL